MLLPDNYFGGRFLKTKKLKPFLCWVVLSGCGVVPLGKGPDASKNPSTSSSPFSAHFSVGGDVRQELVVQNVSPKEIRFQLKREGDCEMVIEGKAQLSEGDPEIYSDYDSDLVIPMEEYIFNEKSGFWLSIDLSLGDWRFAVVYGEEGGKYPCKIVESLMMRRQQ